MKHAKNNPLNYLQHNDSNISQYPYVKTLAFFDHAGFLIHSYPNFTTELKNECCEVIFSSEMGLKLHRFYLRAYKNPHFRTRPEKRPCTQNIASQHRFSCFSVFSG